MRQKFRSSTGTSRFDRPEGNFFSLAIFSIYEGRKQGDQIGRIFGHLGDCFLWVVFLIAEADQIFELLFTRKNYVLVLTENVLGNILGDFCTNSFGHPGRKLVIIVSLTARSIFSV
jgi:hypothetical protein